MGRPGRANRPVGSSRLALRGRMVVENQLTCVPGRVSFTTPVHPLGSLYDARPGLAVRLGSQPNPYRLRGTAPMSNSDATLPAAANSTAPSGGSGVTNYPNDRRKRNIPVASDRRAKNAAEKRKNSERRRLIDPTTCERDYTDEEAEFMKAMDRYKRENRRPFPTWSEVLEVLHSLGYRRVAEPTSLPGGRRESGVSGSTGAGPNSQA